MGKQRIVLEHHRGRPLGRLTLVHPYIVDGDRPVRNRLMAGNQA